MTPTPEAMREFVNLYKREFDDPPPADEIGQIAEELLSFLAVVGRNIPTNLDESENLPSNRGVL